jgi:D-galactarolactone cycloisomerase
MKITEVEAWLCHYPLPGMFMPTWIPGFPQTKNSCLILIMKTDTGLEGYAAGVGFLDEAKGLMSLLRPFVMNRDPFQVEDFIRVLRSAAAFGYRAFFVELGFWDLIGKAAGLPLYKLWGGRQSKLLAYASTGELHAPEKRVEEVLALKERGFKAVKLRLKSEKMADDIDLVEQVRDAVGDEMEIMCDANQGWPIHGFGPYPVWTVKRAIETCQILEELSVRWMEEPLYRYDYEGYARLRDATTTPIAGGEFNVDLHEFRDLIERGCLDIIQPDATISTGMWNSRKVAAMAEAWGLEFSPHTWTNGIGLAANLQIMASAPNAPFCEFPFEPPGWVPAARDFMLREPIEVGKDGYIVVSDQPGLGIELDLERIKSCGEKI